MPVTDQSWIDFDQLRSRHANKWTAHGEALFSIKTVPGFAIDQRASLLCTPNGNVLWDCLANLGQATLTLVKALGGLHAIAISHPHYYTTMQWAAAFHAPFYLHAADSEWIVRDSPLLTRWQGESLALLPSMTLLRMGGYFPGGCITRTGYAGG